MDNANELSRLHASLGGSAETFASIMEMDECQRATRMGKAFAMWPLSEYGNEAARQDLHASTLADAVVIATPPPVKAALAKGGWPAFVILETDDTAREGKARQVLHFYTVKSKRSWRPIDTGGTACFAIPYAVHAGSLPVEAFTPRRPFDAALDDPANGRQPGEGQLVESRR